MDVGKSGTEGEEIEFKGETEREREQSKKVYRGRNEPRTDVDLGGEKFREAGSEERNERRKRREGRIQKDRAIKEGKVERCMRTWPGRAST